MSNFVVHFTKSSDSENDYKNMMGICSQQKIVAKNRFGIGKDIAPKKSQQHASCFSEVPPGHWERLVKRRKTRYGIAFNKEFIQSQGGNPIWYAWKNSPPWMILQNMMNKSLKDPSASIWKLTPFIDAPGKYGKSHYKFDWEREWRCIGNLNFSPDDVAFLLIPEHLHSNAKGFFQDVHEENRGPAYFCPYVDPTWSKERILNELKPRKI